MFSKHMISVAMFGMAAATPTFDVVQGHEGHSATTYEIAAVWQPTAEQRVLRVAVQDEAGAPLAARLSLQVDGEEFIPDRMGEHGIRFQSIHLGKRNSFTATYARGSGVVKIPLPSGKLLTVHAARGFEYLPVARTVDLSENGQTIECRLTMRKWSSIREQGWQAVDEHVHYERLASEHDDDWLTMLDADGLAGAHFLVLKGGNVPGIWAQQYAHGPSGEAKQNGRFIRAGEEYRDSAQGHMNLLGLRRVIEPISTGGIGNSPKGNWPPLAHVIRETHRRGGLAGPAHGGALARSSTLLLDSVLGENDFIEIANSHLLKTDLWYLLLDCGIVLPPVAGTDLPNFGYRDAWQPLFGEVRTYTRSDEDLTFDTWAAAIRRGETMVTSGPLLEITVNKQLPGSIIYLQEPGEIKLSAILRSPRELQQLEILKMSSQIFETTEEHKRGPIHELSLQESVWINESCWLAARGRGGAKVAIERGLGIRQDEFAHSAAIQVIVSGKPIRSEASIAKLREHLVKQQAYYQTQAELDSNEDRREFLALFEEALARLDAIR